MAGVDSTSSAGSNSSADQHNQNPGALDSGIVANSNGASTAQTIAGSPTSSENLMSSPTTVEMLASQAASEQRLRYSTTLADSYYATGSNKSFPDIIQSTTSAPAESHSINMNLYANEEKTLSVGSLKAEYSPAVAQIDSEKSNLSASMGIDLDATAIRATGAQSLASLAHIAGTATLATVNAHVKLSAHAEFKGFNSNASAKASAGAEAMAADVSFSGDFSITPKTVGDTLASGYNAFIDPVVDWLAGEDIPGLPSVPDSWDHGVSVGGHLEGGYGASAKASAGLEFGNGKGARISAGAKLGVGPVIGGGLSFGIK